MKENKFAQLKQKISDFPLWIKEVLYVDIEKNLRTITSADEITLTENDLFQYACPQLTFQGRQELVNRAGNHPQELYMFLSLLDKQYSIIEIMLEKIWTLEEVATQYIMAYELGFVEQLPSKLSETAALYFASKIRVGEYLKKIGKINFVQLEIAINKQREYLAKDEKKLLGEILIELGFIQKKDLQSIVTLKDESKKRFDLNLDFSNDDDAKIELEKRISNLEKQNAALKTQLRAFIEDEKF